VTWKARVVDDFPMLGARLHVADVHGDISEYVVKFGPGRETTMQTTRGGEAGPEGMLIPGDAIEAIRDALDVYLGKPRDDYRARWEEARDALAIERARVDAFLAASDGAA
jgi:hypothetical protein